MKDLYYILGVGKNAAPAEIDDAYGILSAKLKPTAGDNDHFLQNHFNEITEAYAILSNPAKRKVYDAALKRNHLKQLARFKAKTANAFLALSIILITGLIGFYLVNLINSHTATKKVSVTDTVVAVAQPIIKKHHRHKHHNKVLIAKANKPAIILPKQDLKPIAKPILKPLVAAEPKTQKLITDTAKKQVKKPVYAVAKPTSKLKDTAKIVKFTANPAPIKHLVLVKATTLPATTRDSSYITYLKNNLRDSVYMHQLADYMSPVVSVLAANARVRVIEKGHNFYKVASNRQTGYIPKWALVKP